jgi:hypothetical protein
MTSTRRTADALLAGGLMAAILLAAPAAAQRGPAPASTHLPADVLSLACAPKVAFEAPAMPLRVTGGQDSFIRRTYLPGDLMTINAGTINGIAVGQEFFVRRLQISRREPVTPETPASIRTTGWIKVYAVDDEMSLATVTHACDTIEVDDYLEPFALPTVVEAAAERGKPERDNYGRVMVGSDRRRSFGKGDFVIVNRGSEHGVTAGAHFVFYRDKRMLENFLYDLGEAVAVEVKADISTLHVTVSRDVIQEGDYVSMRK